MNTIKITLETLYDSLRNEKKREDLQKLEASFFLDLAAYVREKKVLLEQQKENDNVFSAGDKEKLEYELRSINRILKELYEKREKKIIDIALNKSRTSSDLIDTSSMLLEEKDFYQRVLAVLDCYRRGILFNLTRGELPEISENNLRNYHYENQEKVESSESGEENTETMTVRLKRPVPKFVWKEGKVFGPFDPGEEMEFPFRIAELLIRKDRAEKI